MERMLNTESLWQENNLNYLNEALNWLRIRLMYLIGPKFLIPEAGTIACEKMREAATKKLLSNLITLSQKFGLTEVEQNLRRLFDAAEDGREDRDG